MRRPAWLKEGCRVRRVVNKKRTGTVAEDCIDEGLVTTVMGKEPRFWVDWDVGIRTHSTVERWRVELEPAEPLTKDTNPKDAIGITKAPMSVLPMPAVQDVALAMMEGALKYGRHNWRRAGIRYSVYFDAMMRHMNAWWEGEDIDADSGLTHPVKAAACLLILTDAMKLGNANDDRPPKASADWMQNANEHAKKLLTRFPDPVEPNTEL